MRLLIGRHTRWSATDSAVYGFVSLFCSSYSLYSWQSVCASNFLGCATVMPPAVCWPSVDTGIVITHFLIQVIWQQDKASYNILPLHSLYVLIGARWITIHSEPLAKTTRENVKDSKNLFQSMSRPATVVLVSLPPAFNQCFLLLFKNKSLYGSASAFLLFICKSDASDSTV